MNHPAAIVTSTAFVVNQAKYVRINQKALESFCEELPQDLAMCKWYEHTPFPLFDMDEKRRVHLMLAFNALSFSYWIDEQNYWHISGYDRGSWSLVAALLRAEEEGINILDCSVQKELTKSQLEHVLRGEGELPLIDERLAIIREVGKIVSKKYDNDLRNMLHADAPKTLATIIREFTLFNDCAHYKNQTIYFYKRAQALVASLDLPNTNKLTALADYILPRRLRDKNILIYESPLAQLIDNRTPIPRESEYEIEIRAATIQVVEYIKTRTGISAQAINDYLWLTGDTSTSEIHRTRTTAY